MTREKKIKGICRNCEYKHIIEPFYSLNLMQCSNPKSDDYLHVIDREHGCPKFEEANTITFVDTEG